MLFASKKPVKFSYKQNELYHIGIKRRSGRYPWGSGDDPYQHGGDFRSRVLALKRSGLNEKEVALAVGLKNTAELRKQIGIAKAQENADILARAQSMLDDGYKVPAISKALNIPDSTLRYMLKDKAQARTNALRTTVDFLKAQVDEKGMIDVGIGIAPELHISNEKLSQALAELEKEGYAVYSGGIPQMTNLGKQTTQKVLCPPGTPHKEIYNYDKVNTITDYTLREDEDGSEHFDRKFEYPASMDSSRLMIRFRDDIAPDGHTGVERDGLIELRRNVDDLSLGNSHYAQVRILVDGNKYLKGMAVYSDDMPDGVDVIFNTNKTRDKADSVLKNIGSDPNNPFGALIKENGGQYHYTDENGERKLGLINKTNTEGDWGEWSKTLPSQFLAKQSMQLIEKQLGLSMADKRAEYEEICSYNNPVVKKRLLQDFADDCDSTAVNLQAAALPGQRYHVIIPVPTLKDNEVYAPNYEDGSTIALVRFPHAGTFEIPILKVNNKHKDGISMMSTMPADAIGVNAAVAEKLSGADFDGDTVLTIPCNYPGSKVRIQSMPSLEGLKGFDPKIEYGFARKEVDSDGKEHYFRDGHEYKPMTEREKQFEMGVVSNLISDMTLRGASAEEIAPAARHAMVVIDALKHKLDWRQSAVDNHIDALKEEWQKRVDDDGSVHTGGASTLLSRAKSPARINKRKGTPTVDPETGEEIYKEADPYTDKNGKTKYRTEEVPLMSITKDAHKLSSGTPQEEAYADYANYMKSMANKARLEILRISREEKVAYSKEAKAKYQDEVDVIEAQLKVAQSNAPRERTAQRAANVEVAALKKDNPDMTKKELKKKSQQALSKYRTIFGAKRTPVDISPRGWEAIQSGAFSEDKLTQILRFADMDKVRDYAMPKTRTVLSLGKQAKINAMKASGYATADIAKAIGVSPSTVQKYAVEGRAA